MPRKKRKKAPATPVNPPRPKKIRRSQLINAHALQLAFAQIDMMTQPSMGLGYIELLLMRYKALKIKIYQEVGHRLPHVHIDYGRDHHVASYMIENGRRLSGNLDK